MRVMLDVVQPGLMTTVQDRGRTGSRGQGVPVSGALDWVALRLVNTLAGNPSDTAVLETRLTGPTLTARGGSVRLALSGGLEGQLTSAKGSRAVAPWSTVVLGEGDTLATRPAGRALIGYLAISGGIDIAPVMGSRATYVRAGLGGIEGRALVAGDCLALFSVQAADGADRRYGEPYQMPAGPIRVIEGPQRAAFTDAAWETLVSSGFQATPEMDRMGLRLSGAILEHVSKQAAEVPSEGMLPGCIQVPGNGQPIVMLADGQTVGGYAKPAVVITADLPRVAALRPGDTVHFAAVSQQEAEAALADVLRRIDKAEAGIVAERWQDGFLLDALYGGNLIDGVVHLT